ncbi:3-hydroxyisobutyrate dehydrogenase, mitochondrial-like [Halichondria panicea]|uniref:3-hydroxyisobutyrate dehydrogenase, mitochondrial-like n=1 Tax=Halichondria panicea TaxID=6063 RepID=UPI00312BAB9F
MSLLRVSLLCRAGLSRPVLSVLSHKSYSTNNEPVGFIGLGNMGAPMANNLLQKGHKLVVYDIAEAAVSQAVSAGAVKATSPAEVAKQANTIVTMLPAGSHVLECYKGENGIFSTVSRGALLIDSSTIDRGTVSQVFSSAQERGVTYLDAPVSGGVGAATKGVLTFMVGGDKESCDQATSLLECMGRTVVHCGDSGTGQVAKICNNMLLAIEMIGTSEALQLGINLGMDPKRLTDIINVASGRSWSSEVYNPCPGVMENVPSSNNYQGGFGTTLMLKDLGLAMDAAASSQSTALLGSMATQVYRMMSQHGYADKDFSSVFKFIEKEK